MSPKVDLPETLVSELEDRFRIMADSSPVMLWMSETDGRCTFFNAFWLRFTGRSLEQERDYGWAEGIHFEDFQRCIDTYMRHFSRRQPFSMEYRLKRHDGEFRWLLDNGVPRYLKDGRFAGYIGSCIDITDRIQLEQEKELLLKGEQDARRAAEDANRLKDEFLATVSHELRTPLNAILGWGELLLSDTLRPPEANVAKDTIMRNAKMQLRLINDLVDMSKIITGKMELAVTPVRMGELIRAAVASVGHAALAKNIALGVDPDENPVDEVFFGDAERLQQIAWNLLSNAVKFTPRDGKIRIGWRKLNKEIELFVEDSGQGIAPEFLPFVFDRFRQEDGTITRHHGGLGLGLSIVKHLAELHGGRVSAHSEGHGHGATFRVILPFMPRPPKSNDVGNGMRGYSSRRSALDDRNHLLKGIKILVVDDQTDALSMVSMILSQYGATVIEARSVAEAIGIIERVVPDALVSDIGMPQESGYDLMRQLKMLEQERGFRVPAAALTAHSRPEDRAHALEVGFALHIAKPVEPKVLAESIIDLLKARERRADA